MAVCKERVAVLNSIIGVSRSQRTLKKNGEDQEPLKWGTLPNLSSNGKI